MASKRPMGFGDMPSSCDLGRLVTCEREFVAEHRDGLVSNDRGLHQASERGERAHLHVQVSMETFHNRGSQSGVDKAVSPSSQDSRCVVASAVYRPDAPSTAELRVFRDERLTPSSVGRSLVRFYYSVAPALSRWTGLRPAAMGGVRHIQELVRGVVSRS